MCGTCGTLAGRKQAVPVGLGAALLLQQVQPAFAEDAAAVAQPTAAAAAGADPVDQFVNLATDAVKVRDDAHVKLQTGWQLLSWRGGVSMKFDMQGCSSLLAVVHGPHHVLQHTNEAAWTSLFKISVCQAI